MENSKYKSVIGTGILGINFIKLLEEDHPKPWVSDIYKPPLPNFREYI